MKRILFSVLFLAIFSTGCSVYQINSKDMYEDYFVPKTNVDDVTYVEKTDKAYTVIAEVTVTTERRQYLTDILPKLKQEAGMLGADAITDVQSDATELWKKIGNKNILNNAYIRSTYTAKAIVWK